MELKEERNGALFYRCDFERNNRNPYFNMFNEL